MRREKASRVTSTWDVRPWRELDVMSRSLHQTERTQAWFDGAAALSSGEALLVTRRLGGTGTDPNTFGFRWFWPSILRDRRPLGHVLQLLRSYTLSHTTKGAAEPRSLRPSTRASDVR